MFEMRFEVRRRWSRVVFCLLGLLPTVFITGAIAVTRSPMYHAARHAALEARLSAHLGLAFQAASFERRGRDWVIHKVELRDPETDQWMLRAASVEFSRTGSQDIVLLHQAELCGSRLLRAGHVLHEHLLKRPHLSQRKTLVSAETLTMRYDQQAESLGGVRGELISSDDGSEALCEFTLPGSGASEPARLRLIRNRQVEPPATAWELYTGGAVLPCSLATPWIPAAGRLGAGSTFVGRVRARRERGGWTADVSGTFEAVQLEQLVTAQFPHKLSGEGQVAFRQLRMDQGRIVALAGDLHARDGVVSRSLLTAARDELQLTAREPMDDVSLFRYDQLDVDFTLNGNGLVLVGLNASEKAIMSDAHGTLLSGGGDTLSPLAMLRLLVPQHDMRVPACEETASLVGMLPLPQAQSSSKSYGTVRLLD
jgi:hypothetical protein